MKVRQACALLAAIAILAGPATAQIALTPPPGTAPAPKASGGADLGSAQLYATVDRNGLVDAGKTKGTIACPYTGPYGATCKFATGQYAVYFARNVEGCAVSVTPQIVGLYFAAATVAPNGVQVTFMARSAAPNFNLIYYDSEFTLLVLC